MIVRMASEVNVSDAGYAARGNCIIDIVRVSSVCPARPRLTD